MGRPKQAVEIEGRTLLTRAVEACLAGGCSPVRAILGAGVADLARWVPGGAEVVVHVGWAEGIGSTVRVAIAAVAADPDRPDAVLLAVCDQPAFDAAVVRRLLRTRERSAAPIVASAYAGTVGVPAVFDRVIWPELAALAGDCGARDVIRRDPDRVCAVPWPPGARDVDRPADLDA